MTLRMSIHRLNHRGNFFQTLKNSEPRAPPLTPAPVLKKPPDQRDAGIHFSEDLLQIRMPDLGKNHRGRLRQEGNARPTTERGR